MKTSLLAILAASVAMTAPAIGMAQEFTPLHNQGGKEIRVIHSGKAAKISMLNAFGLPVAVGIVAVAAFAGGGGGGGKDRIAPAPPAPPPPLLPPDPPPTDGESMWILKRDYLSNEKIINAMTGGKQASQSALDAIKAQDDVRLNYAMRNSNLYNKMALGLTGKGVDVVVVDTGIDFNNVNLTDASRGDVVRLMNGINFLDSENAGLRHGTGVAQVIAGDVGDDNHARGIAPGVTLHDITAIREVSGLGNFTASDVRMEMLNAISRGDYDIANMSFSLKSNEALKDLRGEGNKYFTAPYRNAIKGAFDKGTILVISTGNDRLASTNNLYTSIGFMEDITKGQVMAVAALNEYGKGLATYSNACGQAKYFCISATGNFYPVMRDGGKGSFSGTSSAAPVVSASLALLKEQFPELTSGELVELVFATADDLGEKGIDDVFGRGALNMNRAMVPVGELRYINGIDTGSASVGLHQVGFEANTATSALKFALSEDKVTLVDDFNRGFEVAAADLIDDNPERIQPIAKFETRMDIGNGSQIIFAGEDGAALKMGTGLQFGFIKADAMVSEGELFDRGYHALSILDRAYVAGWDFGSWDIAIAKSENSKTVSAWAGYDFGKLDLKFGAIHEDGGLLGAQVGSGETSSAFLSASYNHDVSDSLSFFVAGNAVGSKFKSGQGLIESADIFSASAQIGASLESRLGKTTIALGTPLAASNGTLDVNLPVGRSAAIDNQVSTSVLRDISSRDIERKAPIDLGVSHEFGLGSGKLKLSAMTEVGGTEWGKKDAYVGITYSLKF